MPTGRRPRWFLTLHPGARVHAWWRHVRGRVLLLWDRLPAHRSRQTAQALARQRHWLIVEWMPAYAPELNPIEQLWNHLDATALANTPADDLRTLRRQLRTGLQRLRRRPPVGRAFLKHAGFLDAMDVTLLRKRH